jgi:hypothetical protein
VQDDVTDSRVHATKKEKKKGRSAIQFRESQEHLSEREKVGYSV